MLPSRPARSAAPRVLVALAVLLPQVAAQDLALHVPAEDGTLLAVDVHFPEGVTVAGEGEPVPAMLELTRYWRGAESVDEGRPIVRLRPVDRALLDAGYALVKVDVRGSGASLGQRQMEYGTQEVQDGAAIVDWVVAQPWSSGAVGAYGTSYTGTTAELLPAIEHPAVRAVVPGWSDFDVYRSPVRPYGLYVHFVSEWSRMVAAMDANDSSVMGAHVRRVDGDEDGALRDAAVEAHGANPNVEEAVRAAPFRDDVVAGGPDTYADATPLRWQAEIERSGVPMLVFASWLDAGTAAGALERLQRLSNPQYVVILASSHGGLFHASPYTVDNRPLAPRPSFDEQIALRLVFLDHHMKGPEAGRAAARAHGLDPLEEWPRVRYWHMGEEAMRTSEAWPPPGVERRRAVLAADGVLSFDEPEEQAAWDDYEVDFEVSTGRANRWFTQMGRPVLGLSRRADADASMLTYTSEPLAEALDLTGTPTVRLHLRSTASDGAVFVYLEDVDPDGRSRYLTEGGLRLSHRTLDPEATEELGFPVLSHRREDARPLVPGEPVVVELALWPLSARLAAGHRLRVAFAGADADTFARVPAGGTPILALGRGGASASFVTLPVVAK